MKFTYSLYQYRPHIYLLQVDNLYDLGFIFWRTQEFYESSNPQFMSSKFTLLQHMDWFAKTISHSASFSYQSDYIGYNVPSSAIHDCYRINDERIVYDHFMLQLYSQLSIREQGHRFYLIGAQSGDKSVIDHELAHALYYTNDAYKQEMILLLNQSKIRTRFENFIVNKMGYARHTATDEAQAYLATGLNDDIVHFESERPPFTKTFRKYRKMIGSPLLIETKTIDFFE